MVPVDSYTEDFFEQLYHAELEHKQKLDTADSFLVGIVAALMGVGAYFLQTMAKADFGFALCCFWFLSLPYFVALIVALCYVMASIWPREKNYIASPKQWAEYVDGYEKHYGFWHKETALTDKVALELAALRRQQYIEAGETNRILILKKHGYQTWAKRWIVGAVVLMLLSALPVYFVQRAVYRAEKNAKSTSTTTDSTDSTNAPISTDATSIVAPTAASPTHGDSPHGRRHSREIKHGRTKQKRSTGASDTGGTAKADATGHHEGASESPDR